MSLIIDYKPRDVFKPYHQNDKRFSITIAHRRAGKTVARVNRIIKEAVLCKKEQPRFGYLAPYYVQAKDIAWLYFKRFCLPLIELGAKCNESELSITMPHNGAIIKLYGAENADRMRGLYFDGIVIDEAQDISRGVINQVIMPALSDRQGWLDVSGTVRGTENLLYDFLVDAQATPQDWFWQVLKASETNIIDPDELLRLKKLMSDNEYAQEFECDFNALVTGLVYGAEIAQSELEGRILDFEYQANVAVNTVWDLGFDDATAIWFYQQSGNEIHLIDYYENSLEKIEHYCSIVASKPYHYGNHYVPHDAANKTLQGGGRSIISQAHELGVRMNLVQATTQQNAINALSKVFPRLHFHKTNCKDGLRAIKNYRYIFDNDRKRYKEKPYHDWASHGCDALEMIARVIKQPESPEIFNKPRFLNDMTADELFWGNEVKRETRI